GRIDGGAVGNARVTARRRRHAFPDPAIEVGESGAKQPSIVDHAAQVAGALRPAPRVGGHGGRVGGRPDAEAVLGAAPVIYAHVGTVLHIARARGVGVDEGGVAAVVLEPGVRVEDLEPAA